jgi:hypothetical protein
MMMMIVMYLMQLHQNEGRRITPDHYFTFMLYGKTVIEKAVSTADTVNRARRDMHSSDNSLHA